MPPELNTLRTLWFAFLMSQVIFVGIGFGVLDPVSPDDEVVFGPVFGFLGLVNVSIGLFAAPFLFRKVPALTGYIVRWAFMESTALFGFVLHFTTGEVVIPIALHGLGILGIAVLFPTADRFTAWEMRRLAEQDGEDA